MTDAAVDAAFDALVAAARTDAAAPLTARWEDDRLARLTLDAGGLSFDFTKRSWSLAALEAALRLAEAADLEGWRARLFAGEAVNASEGRAVLHMALRAADGADLRAQGAPVMAEVSAVRERMKAFAEAVREGRVTGADGRRIETVLHIGIGGSDLGPRLVWEALRPLQRDIDLRFVANVDPYDFAASVADLDPASTLVVIVSKTFTTQETMANATLARDWLRAALGPQADAQMAAVSTAVDKCQAFGIPAERVFGFWDWVGGRYSLWSAVGLSCAIALGWEAFSGLLDGAAEMDDHFRTAPLDRNAPVLSALALVYDRNGRDRAARTVAPYAQRLRLLPAFLQQLEMESNGKAVGRDGRPLTRPSQPVVFGDAGTNGQHAFFQQIHQGTDPIPVDFVLVKQGEPGFEASQRKLLANGIAQAEALLVGKSEAVVRAELAASGLSDAEIDVLAAQKTFSGDRPSTAVVAEALTPRTLGALLAFYEHQTFAAGILWGLNSFDQWGVELGKVLAARVLPELEGAPKGDHDPSTTALIARLGAS